MNRNWSIWIVFTGCVAVLLGGMGWLSATIVRLDNEAQTEETVRLAMWRIESAINKLKVKEISRSPIEYRPLYTTTVMTAMGERDEVRTPSELLHSAPKNILLYFQLDPDGRLTSPQVPVGPDRRWLEFHGFVLAVHIEDRGDLLKELQQMASYQQWVDSCEPLPAFALARAAADNQLAFSTPRHRSHDYDKRSEEIARAESEALALEAEAFSPFAIQKGNMNAAWLENELFLVRQVEIDGAPYMQGCWLDAEMVCDELRTIVKDLLPEATLIPAANGGNPSRVLASLPLQLIPGRTAIPGDSAMLISLGLAILGVIIAAATVGMLLRGVISLSERRAAFVSAVTHELRTPLTTFKLYTEMLAGNKLTNPDKRQRYLETLRAEADRLGHLVENVLAFARLDRGRSPNKRIEPVRMSEVLDHARARLEQRTHQAGMGLVVDNEDAWGDLRAFTDPAATEHVLFNLVDNACKYAAASADKTIHLSAAAHNGMAEVRVRDHGPGISEDVRPRLFQPFNKSETEAANTAPGVGLGLSLCRRLARDMGGDLVLEPTPEGACFVLSLRRSDG